MACVFVMMGICSPQPRVRDWASLELLGASLELLGTSLELLGASLELLCASSDAEYRGAHEVLRRLPVHEFGHCVWRAICRVLENPLHGLSENQAPRWPNRSCAVLIPCLFEPLPIVGLLWAQGATLAGHALEHLHAIPHVSSGAPRLKVSNHSSGIPSMGAICSLVMLVATPLSTP